MWVSLGLLWGHGRFRDDGRNGDLIVARFVVWQRHHALTLLLNDGETKDPMDVEMRNVMQLQVELGRKSEAGADTDHQTSDHLERKVLKNSVFVEICQALGERADGAPKGDNRYDDTTPHKEQLVRIPNNVLLNDEHLQPNLQGRGGGNLDPTSPQGKSNENGDEGGGDRLADLRKEIAGVLAPGWQGLNTDLTVLPPMHPFAMVACQWTQEDANARGVFHVFTDGSMRQGKSAWAFVVVCEQKGNGMSGFVRIGYAADRVRSDIGPCEQLPKLRRRQLSLLLQNTCYQEQTLMNWKFISVLMQKVLDLVAQDAPTLLHHNMDRQLDKEQHALCCPASKEDISNGRLVMSMHIKDTHEMNLWTPLLIGDVRMATAKTSSVAEWTTAWT